MSVTKVHMTQAIMTQAIIDSLNGSLGERAMRYELAAAAGQMPEPSDMAANEFLKLAQTSLGQTFDYAKGARDVWENATGSRWGGDADTFADTIRDVMNTALGNESRRDAGRATAVGRLSGRGSGGGPGGVGGI